MIKPTEKMERVFSSSTKMSCVHDDFKMTMQVNTRLNVLLYRQLTEIPAMTSLTDRERSLITGSTAPYIDP